MSEHTPEPWEVLQDVVPPRTWQVWGPEEANPAPVALGVDEEADARRIVACVNALAGLDDRQVAAVPRLIRFLIGAKSDAGAEEDYWDLRAIFDPK